MRDNETDPGTRTNLGMKKSPGKAASAVRPCGLLRHLAVMLYDALVVIALWMLATALAMAAGFEGRVAMKDPGFTLYLAAVWFLYLTWCWRRGGMTVGMRAWRVRIQDESGRRPGWGRCALRFLAALLSALPAGAGFAWSLVDDERRSWHDRISRTRLIRFA
ncbi:MAG: RDD family protein [Xanthomonadales bacterium]|nr:RDD family protein [Xanthomonadales bacterium]